jgi:hypothetical protein
MLTSVLPYQQNISSIFAMHSTQTFAGTNLGIINYGNSEHLDAEITENNKLTIAQALMIHLRPYLAPKIYALMPTSSDMSLLAF